MSMLPPRQLPRGKSSSSLSSEGKKKPLKQYTAGGIKLHSRNSSYGQSLKLNKLSRIASTESIEDSSDQRPLMSRSKSSDGALLKRNRSKTKLVAGLQPLTRTISSQSHKTKFQKHPRGQVAFNSGGSDSEEEVDDFDDDPNVIQNSTELLNVNNNNDINNSEKVLSDIDESRQLRLLVVDRDQQGAENSMPKYFGNILSQSTGMERSIVPSDSVTHSLNNSEQRGNSRVFPLPNGFSNKSSLDQIRESPVESLGSRVPRSMKREDQNESYSSFQSSNLIFQPSSTNIARHYNQQQTNNQSIPASASSRAGAQLDSKGSSASLATDFTKNFREFLNKTPEGETRTQQKLWLQRESSILNIMQSSKNYQHNNAQFRTEFEKFSREYLNVRRHVNPVLGSLKRLTNMDNELIKSNNGNQDISSFAKFSPRAVERIGEHRSELSEIWEIGWRDHNTSSTSMNELTNVPNFVDSQRQYQSRLPLLQQQQDINQRQRDGSVAALQQQQQQQQQLNSRSHQRPSNNITLSSPQLPMTRAVAKNGGVSIL